MADLRKSSGMISLQRVSAIQNCHEVRNDITVYTFDAVNLIQLNVVYWL